MKYSRRPSRESESISFYWRRGAARRPVILRRAKDFESDGAPFKRPLLEWGEESLSSCKKALSSESSLSGHGFSRATKYPIHRASAPGNMAAVAVTEGAGVFNPLKLGSKTWAFRPGSELRSVPHSSVLCLSGVKKVCHPGKKPCLPTEGRLGGRNGGTRWFPLAPQETWVPHVSPLRPGMKQAPSS